MRACIDAKLVSTTEIRQIICRLEKQRNRVRELSESPTEGNMKRLVSDTDAAIYAFEVLTQPYYTQPQFLS